MELLGFVAGLLVGIFVVCIGVSRLIIGKLITVNEPGEDPYIFVELNESGLEKIDKKKYVVLEVGKRIDMSHD